MTLGNSPQPLTRRQLRELARANEPATVDDEPAAVEAADDAHDTETGSHSRHTAPRADQPVEPARNEPKSREKTGTHQFGTDQSGPDQSGTDESGTEKSGTGKSGTGKSGTEKVGTEKAGTEKSGGKKSSDSKATAKSAAGKTADAVPAAVTPAPAKPASTKPAAGKPGAMKPGAVPAALKPSAVKPEAETPAAASQDRGTPEAARPAPAPLPMPDAAPKRTPVVIDSVVVDPGRALTRRELRALQTAASASATPDSEPSRPDAPAADAPSPAAAASTASEPTGLTPPMGHWSIDRDDDSHIETIGRRDDQTFDDLVGRGIGAGGIPTTTNALILPAIPRQGNAGPITSTGEIMITGSIDLPRSLGATGQHPNLFDSSEMDRMLDQLDEGGHHNDVAPVSASRAVSTHTSTRGVMTPPRKRGASLPTVLAITAAVLAIGVLSLFVVGYAFNIY
jgi:hypothetical protein